MMRKCHGRSRSGQILCDTYLLLSGERPDAKGEPSKYVWTLYRGEGRPPDSVRTAVLRYARSDFASHGILILCRLISGTSTASIVNCGR